MAISSIEELAEMMREYYEIEQAISRKQRMLKIRLCDRKISVRDAMSAFTATENEIDYLIRKWKLITKILSKLNENDLKIIVNVIRYRNIFCIADELRISASKVQYRILKIIKKLTDEVTFDNIYGLEEECAYE